MNEPAVSRGDEANKMLNRYSMLTNMVQKSQFVLRFFPSNRIFKKDDQHLQIPLVCFVHKIKVKG